MQGIVVSLVWEVFKLGKGGILRKLAASFEGFFFRPKTDEFCV